MNRSRLVVLAVVLTLLALAPAAGSAPAGVPPVPWLVSYQGHVLVGGVPYGTPAAQAGYFKFAIVDLAGTPAYWSNDGTSLTGEEPDDAVVLTVTNGLFSVLLGDTTLEGMKMALTPDAFAGPDRLLRVWFSSEATGTFDRLLPDRRFTTAPYAFVAQEAGHAAMADMAAMAVDAAALGGVTAANFTPAPQNVVIVAKGGGDYGTITAALAAISGTADNPWLIWVAPGVYDETVTMKEFVDIAGAGQGLTRIRAPGTDTGVTGTVNCANNAELRDLTVESTGRNHAIAIRCDSASPRLTRVTATASSGAFANHAVFNSSSSPTMTHVTASASGGYANHAVHNTNSSPVMNDVTATAVRNALAATSNIYNYGVSNFSGSYPAMNRVTAAATGYNLTGDIYLYNYGVYNDGSSPAMNQVVAAASGDNLEGSSVVTNYGVYNFNCSAPIVLNSVTATASGSRAGNTGVYNYNTSLTVRGSTIETAGGIDNTGVSTYRSDSLNYKVEISNSHVQASNHTIHQYWGYTIRVAASHLAGGDISYWESGSFACIGVYDELFASLDATCP